MNWLALLGQLGTSYANNRWAQQANDNAAGNALQLERERAAMAAQLQMKAASNQRSMLLLAGGVALVALLVLKAN